MADSARDTGAKRELALDPPDRAATAVSVRQAAVATPRRHGRRAAVLADVVQG